jgi:gamma-glutamylcyclotransferase (GGCT)/AIG2-like uncharacterized protein YtfP
MAWFSYFAYGSNLLPERLSRRCPSAICLGVGIAEGYRLAFHKKSIDGSAKASLAQESAGASLVYGALFRIAESERALLDKCEGYPKGYSREDSFPVFDPGAKQIVEARTYIATPQAVVDSLLPFHWYKGLVIAGARTHGFPDDYIAALEATDCTLDEQARGFGDALASLTDAGWELLPKPPHIRRRSGF